MLVLLKFELDCVVVRIGSRVIVVIVRFFKFGGVMVGCCYVCDSFNSSFSLSWNGMMRRRRRRRRERVDDGGWVVLW